MYLPSMGLVAMGAIWGRCRASARGVTALVEVELRGPMYATTPCLACRHAAHTDTHRANICHHTLHGMQARCTYRHTQSQCMPPHPARCAGMLHTGHTQSYGGRVELNTMHGIHTLGELNDTTTHKHILMHTPNSGSQCFTTHTVCVINKIIAD